MFEDIKAVALVLTLRTPLQIIGAKVCPSPVDVVYLVLWRWFWAEKSLGNKPVDKTGSFSPAPVAQAYVHVAARLLWP